MPPPEVVYYYRNDELEEARAKGTKAALGGARRLPPHIYNQRQQNYWKAGYDMVPIRRIATRRERAKMDEATMSKCLNEWMRRYTEEPEQFEHEVKTVREFLAETNAGQEPSYGRECAAYMHKIARDLSLL